jgi:transposase
MSMMSRAMYLRASDRTAWAALVVRTVLRAGRNRGRAASRLGVSARTLRAWIKELGLPRLDPGFVAGSRDT